MAMPACSRVPSERPPSGGSRRSYRQLRFGVLGRRDALLDERVPVVAVRALPEQLGAAVAAAHADVRIEVEDRVAGELAVAIDERRRELQLRQRLARSPGAAERVRDSARARRRAARARRAAGRCAARWRASASRARQSCGFSAIRRRQSAGNRSGVAGLRRRRSRAARTPGRRDRARPRPAAPRRRSRRRRVALRDADVAEIQVARARSARSRSIAASKRRAASR